MKTEQIKQMQKQCGTWAIAGMLKNYGFPCWLAVRILAFK